MKQLMNSMIILLLIIWGQIVPAYGTNDESVTIEVDEAPKRELPNRGQRMPSIPVICHISTDNGVSIVGVTKAEIISFELYDSNDMCIGVFSDEEDFMEIFFSDLFVKIHKVCFETEYARYTGYIN